MQILRGIEQLEKYLDSVDCSAGCLADTGFLYGASFTDDRVYPQSLEVSVALEDRNIPIYSNVISRMEFVDLVFRKLITNGAIQMYQAMDTKSSHKGLFDFLKKIRDEDTAAKRENQSFKIGESRLKKLRQKIEEAAGLQGWKEFCATYGGSLLQTEWVTLEEELGLKFVEVLEGQTSDVIHSPLHWADMVSIMGRLGIRGPDAMVINLFKASIFPLLITVDGDFELSSFDDLAATSKAIFVLEEFHDQDQLRLAP